MVVSIAETYKRHERLQYIGSGCSDYLREAMCLTPRHTQAIEQDLVCMDMTGTHAGCWEVYRFGNTGAGITGTENGRIIYRHGCNWVLVRAGRDSSRWVALAGRWHLRPWAYQAMIHAWLRHQPQEHI